MLEGLTPPQQREVIEDFRRWAEESGRKCGNWDLAFQRNPVVRSAVARLKAKNGKNGEDRAEKDRKRTLELAKVLGIEQGAEPWERFEAKVLEANDRRLRAIGRA